MILYPELGQIEPYLHANETLPQSNSDVNALFEILNEKKDKSSNLVLIFDGQNLGGAVHFTRKILGGS